MSKCDDWNNWDGLSPEQKEHFLDNLIADAADQFGIPNPDVNYGDANGDMGYYDSETGITIDPAAETASGHSQFDDAAVAADTAFHEAVHAAQDYYHGEGVDLSGPEAQKEAEDLAKDMVEELNNECGSPPYPGEGGDGEGDEGPLPTTADEWEALMKELEAERLKDLLREAEFNVNGE